jgi:hypothetical protein
MNNNTDTTNGRPEKQGNVKPTGIKRNKIYEGKILYRMSIRGRQKEESGVKKKVK